MNSVPSDRPGEPAGHSSDYFAGDRARRRRLLLGGGAGAILATVKSGSALANGVCVSPSSFHSITATPKSSLPPRTYGTCSSHGFYGNSNNGLSKWGPVATNATLAGAGFPTVTAHGWTGTTKLYDIVRAPSLPALPWNSDGNLIVIYLDIMTGRAGTPTPALSLSDLYDMWRVRFGLGGFNSKFNGWTPTQVANFYDVWVGNTQL